MPSEPRPCPDVDPPKQPSHAVHIKKQDKTRVGNDNAVIQQTTLMVTQSIPVLPQETPATKPENQTQPQDGLDKQDFPLVKQQYPIAKPQNVLPESTSLPKPNIKEEIPKVTEDNTDTVEIQDIPSGRPSHPDICLDRASHPEVCSECGHDILPEPEKCSECGRVLTPPSKTCHECGQIIPPPPEICPQCGQPIRSEPERCTECGQLIPRGWAFDVETAFKNLAQSYESNTGYMFDKWSRDGSSCRASTSRKLSNSSGDYDSDKSSYCSDCSCSSNTYSVIYEKPCIIADSATFLHKSKWQAFRNYFRRIRRRKRIKCRKNDSSSKKGSSGKEDENIDEGRQDSNLTVSARD